MAKTKFKFKLGKIENLEIEIESERPKEIGRLLDAASGSITGIIPSDVIDVVSGQDRDREQALPFIDEDETAAPPPKPTSRKKKGPKKPKGAGGKVEPLKIELDALTASAQQSWKQAEKAAWLLYVLKEQSAAQEAGAGTLRATWNHYFKQKGQLYTSKVTRDLGKLEHGGQSVTQQDPSTGKYFLTDAGVDYVKKQIASDSKSK